MDKLRQHGFVFDDLEDRWQKLAFTLYNIVTKIDQNAKHALGDS